MENVRRYRKRKDREFIVEAVRYGTWDSRWYEEASMDVAKFILGVDVNTRTSILNERMLDVVNPIKKEWDPKKGRADIYIFDRGNQVHYTVSLGDWVLRYPDGSLGVSAGEAFRRDFDEVRNG